MLLLNALLPHPFLWLLYVIAGLAAGLDALQRPSLNALLPRLVERDELAAAGALNGMRSTFGMVAGPAVAGLLIAGVGLPTTYALDVVTFAVSLVALRLMRAVPPPADAERPVCGAWPRGCATRGAGQSCWAHISSTSSPCSLACPPRSSPRWRSSTRAGSGLASGTVLGFLYAAPAVGMFLAPRPPSGWTGRVHRHGIAVILAAGAWGLAITGMGLAPSLFPALVCLAAAGAADAVSGIFRSMIWNQTIPDALRGRLGAASR